MKTETSPRVWRLWSPPAGLEGGATATGYGVSVPDPINRHHWCRPGHAQGRDQLRPRSSAVYIPLPCAAATSPRMRHAEPMARGASRERRHLSQMMGVSSSDARAGARRWPPGRSRRATSATLGASDRRLCDPSTNAARACRAWFHSPPPEPIGDGRRLYEVQASQVCRCWG
eukprot:scaffold1149_cov380-Prasinococcus_capsulatus_cf.AAC.7